ncbi:MAG: hypothetical protein HY854_12895 [Burkholderiales bacterium]|nr:hypothetical protein [Burkholderiales bacterium]
MTNARSPDAPAKVDASGYTRSSYAVLPDVFAGIPGLLEALKMRSLAQLLTMLVRNQDEAVAALGPLAERHNAKLSAAEGNKSTRRKLTQTLKELDHATLQKLLEQAEAAKKQGAAG